MSMTACRCQKGQQSLQQRMQPVIGLLLIFRVLTAGHSDHLHMIIDQITEAGTANDLPAGQQIVSVLSDEELPKFIDYDDLVR